MIRLKTVKLLLERVVVRCVTKNRIGSRHKLKVKSEERRDEIERGADFSCKTDERWARRYLFLKKVEITVIRRTCF